MTRRATASISACLITFCLAGASWAETRTGGDITGQARWTKAGSPYIIISDVVIQPGAKLTIDPGVVVRFKPNLADQKGLRPFDMELVVRGTLEARGADGDTVFFTSDAVEPTWSDWAGIIIPDQGGKAILSQVAIEFAHEGVRLVEGQLDMSRSSIRFCSEKALNIHRGHARISLNYITGIGNFAGTGKGIYLVQSPDVEVDGNFVIGAQSGLSCERGSNAKITNNLFSLCKVYGVTVTNSSPEITGNNITQNEYGLLLTGNANARVRDNNIFENGMYDLKISQYKAGADHRPVELDVTGNWWGPKVVEVIYERIDDAFDDPQIGAIARIEPTRKEAFRKD
jgi:parallel beta-helix repeat protein